MQCVVFRLSRCIIFYEFSLHELRLVWETLYKSGKLVVSKSNKILPKQTVQKMYCNLWKTKEKWKTKEISLRSYKCYQSTLSYYYFTKRKYYTSYTVVNQITCNRNGLYGRAISLLQIMTILICFHKSVKQRRDNIFYFLYFTFHGSNNRSYNWT